MPCFNRNSYNWAKRIGERELTREREKDKQKVFSAVLVSTAEQLKATVDRTHVANRKLSVFPS